MAPGGGTPGSGVHLGVGTDDLALGTVLGLIPYRPELLGSLDYVVPVDGPHRLCCSGAPVTRRGNDWTKRFRKIASDASGIDAGSAILDGEVVVPSANGVRRSLAKARPPVGASRTARALRASRITRSVMRRKRNAAHRQR